MTGEEKKSGHEFGDYGAHRQSASGQDSPTSEFPISEGSDASAKEAKESMSTEFQEKLKRSARESKRHFSAALGRGYSTGSDVLEDVDGEMSTRPWSTFLAGAFMGGIVGYLIATRR